MPKWILTACTALCMATNILGQGNSNIVPNPDFEAGKNKPESWTITKNVIDDKEDKTSVAWTQEGISNGHAIKITVNKTGNGSSGWILEDASLIPANSSRLMFSGWMKTENIMPGENEYQSPGVRLMGYDKDGKFVSNYWVAKSIKLGSDWTKYETKIALDKDIKSIRIFCGMGGCTGTVWFDKLSLTEASDRNTFGSVRDQKKLQDMLNNITEPIIIPQPWQEHYGSSYYTIGNAVIVNMPEANDYLTNELRSVFSGVTKTNIPVIKGEQDISAYKTVIYPVIGKSMESNRKFIQNEEIPWTEIGEEGYVLKIGESEGHTIIVLAANTEQGLFYAVQTLKQSLINDGNKIVLRETRIIDKPSFAWRGMVSGSVSMNRVDKWMVPLKFNIFYGVYSPCRSPEDRYKWWIPFSQKEKEQIRKWVYALGKRFIKPVAGTRPDRGYTRRIKYSSEEEVNTILQTYKDYYECGFRIFKLDYDDGPNFLEYPEDKEKFKDIANAHYYLADRIYKELKALDKNNSFIVGPIHYYNPLDWTPSQKKYIDTLSQLPAEITFINAAISQKESVDELIKTAKHKPLFWDNWATPYEEITPVPSIITAPYASYYKQLSDAIHGYIAPLIDKPMFWYLTSDYMWNASRYNPDYSHLRCMVKLYGKANIQKLYEYENLISEKRGLQLPGTTKEEKLKEAEKLISDFKTAANGIKNMKFPDMAKEADETAADRISLLENVLIPEIKSKPFPLLIKETPQGQDWRNAADIPEEVWKEKAVTLTGFLLPLRKEYKLKAANVQTEIKMLHDKKNLYIKCVCLEPEMKSLKANKTEHDSEIYSDDCVEMMMAPANSASSYFHLAVNANGAYYDAKGQDLKWDLESVNIKTEKTDNSWIVLITIPLESIYRTLGKGELYNFNFFRERYAGKKPEYSAWTAVEKSFHEPKRFWTLQLINQEGLKK